MQRCGQGKEMASGHWSAILKRCTSGRQIILLFGRLSPMKRVTYCDDNDDCDNENEECVVRPSDDCDSNFAAD